MGGKTTSTSDTRINQLSVQSSSLALPLSIGWGRGRMKCNLIWYGAFTAIPHTTKQSAGKGLSGGSTNTTYSYTASVMLALCEGGLAGIAGVRTVYRDTSALTDGATSALAQAGLSLAGGGIDQPVWGYLASRFPDQALAYSGIAYVYAQDYPLGDSATLPNHSFEVDFAIQLGGGVCDADPQAILTDYLTNIAYGVPGWTAGLIGALSDWSLYCRASNLLLSPVLESQQTASETIAEWMTATNSAVFWSEGLLKVRPYGDAPASANGVTWAPDLTPVYDLTEDDFVAADDDAPPVTLDIVDQSDAYNIVQVEFLDRANQYNSAIATAQDLANIIEFGRRKQDPTNLHCICDAGIARVAAQLLLQRTLYVRETYRLQLPDAFILLEPTDYLTLTTLTDELQRDRVLVRITAIEEDQDGLLTLTCEGVPIGIASAALYAAHSGDGYRPNADVAPGSVSTPQLINAPSSLTGGDHQIWCAVASTSPNWGGCEVWISVDDVAYSRVGRIDGPARYGTLTAALPSHPDPDPTGTLSVDLAASLGELGSATAAEANAGGSLCLVGDELVTYEDATLTGAHRYAVTHLRRGFASTAPAAHAIGERFVRLDDAIFKFSYAALNVGATIHIKLPSFNIHGRALEDIASVTAFTVSLAPETALPDPAGGLALAHVWNGASLTVVCNPSARAAVYRFGVYDTDQTTLVREIVSTTPAAAYTSQLAAQDGVRRAYAIRVIASNAAGDAAPSGWLVVSNAAPPAVASPAVAGGATLATATCSASSDPDVAGYILFYSTTSGFNPLTTGAPVPSGVPSIAVFGLPAGTYYGRIAAFDGWTANPTLLNLSSEIIFTITTGGGSTPSGGGGAGGGYRGAGGGYYNIP